MMSESPIVSLCIPTNGVTEWVFPVLDSIVGQNVSPELYEIIVTDNGDNQDFKQKMRAYQEQHKHIVYEETAALSFANQTEAYRFARGLFIKFINLFHFGEVFLFCYYALLLVLYQTNCKQK